MIPLRGSWEADTTLEWTPQRLVELRQRLTKRLSDDDLRTICFDLSKLDSGLNKLDYESLPGVGKAAKIRELLDYCDRQDHIPQLYEMACDLCPAIRKDLEMPRTPLRSGLVPVAKGCYFQYGKLIFGILLTIAVISIASFVIVNAYATSMAVARAYATSTAEAYATQMAMETRRYTPTPLATPTLTFTPTPTPTPAVVVSATVTLQTWSGMYVTVTDITTTGKLKAQDTPIGDRQKFTLLCLANGKTALQIFDRFVSALNDEDDRNWELRAVAERLAWEEFTLVNPDTQASLPCVQALKQLQQSEVRLAFRTFHNRFATAMGQDKDWVLRAETTVLDRYEKFTAINLASTPTSTPRVVVVDTMDSLAGWAIFSDNRFITDTASAINISSQPGMVNNAIQIYYDLKPGGFVGISKVITPGILAGTQSIRFLYKGVRLANTIELKLLYTPRPDGKGEVFSFSQKAIVGTDEWVTFEQLYSAFGCGDTCTSAGQSLDPARVWKLDIAVSHQQGGTPGSGSVIVDQVEAIKSSPCTRSYGCSVVTMATVEPGKSDRFCEETITLSPTVKASGFRIDMTQRALENYGYSLYEVEAYGPADTLKNLLIGGAQVNASSNKGDAPLVIDGKMLYSRWDSEHCCFASCPKDKNGNMLCDNPKWTDHQWLEITLLKPADIERIVLKWEQAYATEYCVIVTPTK